ncbi:hypothetical protein KSP40_PGU014565 [Platanthera guangdongensis]|uniref:Uncharacterized protein n=1 Tax=Platanthera guangdongensis TaxID=2320717 RepID=A0ABR2MK54_9ASPA
MEDVAKTKSFRDEDMLTRRAFLRSYPLRWEEEEEEGGGNHHEEEEEEGSRWKKNKRLAKVKSVMKSNLIGVLQWGEGKILLLRKMKSKVGYYLLACHPFGFKTSKFLTAD